MFYQKRRQNYLKKAANKLLKPTGHADRSLNLISKAVINRPAA